MGKNSLRGDKMELIITVLIAVIGSSGMWGLLQLIYKTKIENKNQTMDELFKNVEKLCDMQSKLCRATKESMQDRICYLAKGFIERGEIPFDDICNLNEMYAAYKDLGLPCQTAVEAMNIVGELPVVAKRGK